MPAEKVNAILNRFHRVELGLNPTPLHRLHNLEQQLGHEPIFIKRDDLNGVGIGGNKIRNLEFLLGDALAKKADPVIVSGQWQSNLCMLTAAACRRVKLNCVIVHNNEENHQLEGNALLNHLLGTQQKYLGKISNSERDAYIEKNYEQLNLAGNNPYFIKNGASTPLGCLGYIQAALELYRQIKTVPAAAAIKSVCVPSGNGGIAAGIIFGTALLGCPFHIEVISVEHKKEQLIPILKGLLAELEDLTETKLPYSLEDVATIHEDFRGGGWGVIDDNVTKFIYEFARTEGIFVEQVYTGKALYGAVQLIMRKHLDSGLCFLHTGGMGALFSQFK